MKFPKTIRFDKSDLNVFEVPSEEGEWAISGAFEFSDDNSNSLIGKRKQSFSNGFLGLTSFGRSTLVSVSKLNLLTKDKLSDNLAKFFIQRYGAPDFNRAKVAANDEINFIIDICKDHELGTLLAVNRSFEENGIHEKFRSLPKQDACSNQKIWTTVSND